MFKKFILISILTFSLFGMVSATPKMDVSDFTEMKGFKVFLIEGNSAENLSYDCKCNFIIDLQNGVIFLLDTKEKTRF
jgi:hypothetical protein